MPEHTHSHTHTHTYYHIHRKPKGVYALSLWQHLHASLSLPLIAIFIVFAVFQFYFVFPTLSLQSISITYFGSALFATFTRLLIAYLIAIAVAIPLALLTHKNEFAEKFLLPLFDIVQSVPILAFFPIIILFFLRYDLANWAAIFIIALSMMWNIVFNVLGGLKVVPDDLKAAATIFHITGFSYVRQIILPAVFPYILVGSLLAWAQGWNIIIVAEVLHTYIPGGVPSQDLFGLGSILVSSAQSGQHTIFFAAVVTIIFAIAVMNLLIWQRLLHYAERFRFE